MTRSYVCSAIPRLIARGRNAMTHLSKPAGLAKDGTPRANQVLVPSAAVSRERRGRSGGSAVLRFGACRYFRRSPGANNRGQWAILPQSKEALLGGGREGFFCRK